jgi:hypothetical protein
MSIVQKLTEGIVNRDLSTEGAALISKWESTGLLEGIGDDANRNGMARLLENQAKELLRESSSMAAGDVEGFAAVAFPLVRRVFGNLIANDLVSVQPMSLPSGLIFFLDFVYSPNVGATGTQNRRLGNVADESIYGGDQVGSQITGGISLDGQFVSRGPYSLNNGYSSPTGSTTLTFGGGIITPLQKGTYGAGDTTLDRLCQYDPDLTSGSSQVAFYLVPRTMLTGSTSTTEFNFDDLIALTVDTTDVHGLSNTDAVSGSQLRRLSQFSSSNGQPDRDNDVIVGFLADTASAAGLAALTASLETGLLDEVIKTHGLTFPSVDRFTNGAALGSVVGAQTWGLEGEANIPEIDIKVDSVAVTAITKKLKAKWTPELGQDLNAYHNLDAEVELTQILSEQIALEIDREILDDLVRGAAAGVRYWSRSPGRFLNRETGVEIGAATTPDFTGNVSEWYETLIETINDVSAQIHRKTLRGAANFVVCGPEVANVLEFTAGFRANVTADSDRGDAGAVKVGSLSKKFDIIVDPYFPRNLVLVGRRGSSFLESGYVYAPYVPLQTTPTIFGVEDFVPRKGVMTRYAKKMVRPDMYGLVIVSDLVGG